LTNRSTKPESASGPVEGGKFAIQMKYTLVRWEKSSEIVPEDQGYITRMHHFVICRMKSKLFINLRSLQIYSAHSAFYG